MDEKPPIFTPEDVPQGPSADAPLKGSARIDAYLKTLPDGPGVYRMLNAKGDVLYVGKASSLKKRPIVSYAKGAGHSLSHRPYDFGNRGDDFRLHRLAQPRPCCSKPISSSGLSPAIMSAIATTRAFPTSC